MTASTNSRKLMLINPEFPKDVTTTVIRGQTASATFEAKILEHGRPAEYTYQWYVNDLSIPGATGESYTLTGLGETVTSTVFCEVTNKKGTVRTRTATLNVEQYYTPVLNSSYPQNVTVENGKSVTCNVSIATAGNPDSYTYQWYKNGIAVSGATSSSYTFTPSSSEKPTVYCTVTNSAGTVTSRTATITVVLYLYKQGDLCTSVSGGWKSQKADNGTITFKEDYVNKTYSGSDLRYTSIYSGKAISVTNYSKLIMRINSTDTTYAINIGLCKSPSTSTTVATVADNMAARAGTKTVSSSQFDISVDISSLSGNYYVQEYTGGASYHIFNIRLER
jgi:hypothetical protein